MHQAAIPDFLHDDPDALLRHARQCHAVGQLADAEAGYRRLLAASDASPLAWHGLGILLARRDACGEALPLLRRALEMMPSEPDFWLDYAATFLLAGQADEAHYILTQAQQHGITHERLPVVSQRIAESFAVTPDLAGIRERFKSAEACGDFSGVETYVRHQIDRFGARSALLQRLGTILLRQQHNAQALDAFDAALAAPMPDLANLHNQRGIVLRRLGRHAQAVYALEQGLAVAPDMVSIWINLGDCLNAMGRVPEAAVWLQKALTAAPQWQEARVNLATSYLQMERDTEARALFETAIAAGHTSHSAQLGLAEVLIRQHQHAAALPLIRQVAATEPKHPEALQLLYRSMLSVGKLDTASSLGDRLLALQPESPEALSGLIFNLHYQGSAKIPALAQRYGDMVRPEQPFTQWPRNGRSTGRLRLGFVSGDLVAHPVAWFLEGMLKQLSKGAFELHAYATRYREDAVTARLKPLFHRWHVLAGQDGATAAARIHADQIDILVDLSGHTTHHRLPLFAWRPAPLQLTWLGWFATTGLKEIDYCIADRTGAPDRFRASFSEQLAWMPHTRLCFTPSETAPPLSPLPCMDRGHITFGSFQRLAKLSAATLSLWSRVLTAMPTARLRLQAPGLQDAELADEIRQLLQAAGLPMDRILFAGGMAREAYLAAYSQVDVVLDTFPYPGGTTTCEALWMGVPTLTLAGDTLLSRQGASLLQAAGLPDWVAASADDYVKKAVALTSDMTALAQWRANARNILPQTPLFDARRFAQDFESLLRKLWRKTALPRISASQRSGSPKHSSNASQPKTNHADAEYAACVALYQQGRSAEALPRIRALAQQLPNSAPVWKVLGATLTAVGESQEALSAKRRAVALDPNDADAQANLGNSLQDAGLLEDAEMHCRAALAVAPEHLNALNNLGLILQRMGRFSEAGTVLEQALVLRPEFAEAMVNLGNVLRDTGEHARAELLYRQAGRIAPDLLIAHMNLAILLSDDEQAERKAEAEAYYRRALELNPNHVETLHGLGNLYRDVRRYKRAEECFQKAVTLDPSHARSWLGLGGVKSYAKGSLVEAIACFEEALRQDPGLTTVRSSLLFNHAYMGDTEPREHLRQAQLYGEDVTRLAQPFGQWQTPATAPLRIGLIGGDFRAHPVGYFLENLLSHLNRQRIEVHVYCNNARDDDMTLRLQKLAPYWTPVHGVHNRVVANQIHQAGIHILIDLAGHTGDNRLSLFPWRASPVQASWLGYFATTGVAEIDWVIADAIGVPTEHQWHFGEKIWYMPDTRLCFSPPQDAPSVAELPALQNGHITFGCVQNLTKINDYTLGIWKRVLDALPQARMRIQAPQFTDMKAKDDFQERLAMQGLDTLRISLLPPAKRHEYLAHMGTIDLMLDTFPYPGGTTTCEALWMGVPTLTLAGNTLLARQGASLLTAAGLPHWVAEDSDDYVRKAITYGQDFQALAALRMGLRTQMTASPLCDGPRFARAFENAMDGMWAEYCEKSKTAV